MKCGEIRDICGDYALDIQYPKETITLYFNSRQTENLQLMKHCYG